MNVRSLLSIRTSVAILGSVVLLPLAAAAQTAPTTGSTTTQGPMTVERVNSGFLVTPEVKFTRFDRQTSELVGADAGWLADKSFFIGGGGYWMPDQSHDRQLAYGGLVLGVSTPLDSPVSFGVKGLIGGGRATVLRSISFVDDPGVRSQTTAGSPGGAVYPPIVTTITNVRVSQDFVVFEPQANVTVAMGKRLRLIVGAGYRWMGRQRGQIDDLSGASGSVGLQIGGGG